MVLNQPHGTNQLRLDSTANAGATKEELLGVQPKLGRTGTQEHRRGGPSDQSEGGGQSSGTSHGMVSERHSVFYHLAEVRKATLAIAA